MSETGIPTMLAVISVSNRPVFVDVKTGTRVDLAKVGEAVGHWLETDVRKVSVLPMDVQRNTPIPGMLALAGKQLERQFQKLAARVNAQDPAAGASRPARPAGVAFGVDGSRGTANHR